MSGKPRVVICWEMGAGQGHVVPLSRIAETLTHRGFDIVKAYFCLLDYAAMLAPHMRGPVRLAPAFAGRDMPSTQPSLRHASFGDFLGNLGYDSHERLARQIGLWRCLLEEDQPDLVIGDYSPTALLAARSLGITTVATGPPYCLPPSHLAEFPLRYPGIAAPRYSETALLATLNSVLSSFGGEALSAFPQVLEADLTGVGSLRQIDCYDGKRAVPLLPPFNPGVPPAATRGNEVIAYLSAPGPIEDPVWEALASLNLPLLILTPRLDEDVRKKLQRPGISVSHTFLQLEEIAARCRVLVSNGNHGILCAGARAALPLVCLPGHGENEANCAGLEKLGAAVVVSSEARTASAIAFAIREVYQSQSSHARARALAAEVEPVFRVDAAATLADQIEATLDLRAGMKPAPAARSRRKSATAPAAPTTRLRCYRLHRNGPDLLPARSERAWMNQTSDRYAYRCVPLSIANASGWEIPLPVGFEAIWDGGPGKEAITLTSLDGTGIDSQIVSSHFGHGVLTFHTGYLLRTDPGWGVWCRGAPNEAKDGIAPLDGLVETDWLPFPFTMNWRFTRPCRVRFEKGEVFCFLMPVAHLALENIEPEIMHLDDNPELKAEYQAWSASRMAFLAKLQEGDAATVQEAWQRFYLRGATATGQAAPDSHRAKRRLSPGRGMKQQREP